MSNNPSTSGNSITLKDGRTLGFSEYGSLTGRPVLYFHGDPGSRFEARFLADEALRQGVRIIGIDRPGMGLSSYKKGRRLLDWPNDVVELADVLRIGGFSVVGFSAGSPYALACTYKLRDRVSTCGIVSGVGHLSPALSLLARLLPWIMLPLIAKFFDDLECAEKVLTFATRRWPEADKRALAIPDVRELVTASLLEAFRQGAKGASYEGVLLGRSWGFQLEQINLPVHLWHGERDNDVPVAWARRTAARLSRCEAVYYSGEGHISTIANHSAEIVAALNS